MSATCNRPTSIRLEAALNDNNLFSLATLSLGPGTSLLISMIPETGRECR
jgi:hypothetical protein